MKGRHCITTLAGAKDRALGRLKNYLEQRTPRQRLYIVLTALLLFAAVDIWMIVSCLSGHSAACGTHRSISTIKTVNYVR